MHVNLRLLLSFRHSLATAALCVAAFFAAPAHAAADPATARALVSEAAAELDEARSARLVEDAHNKLSQALELDPGNAPAMVEMARYEMKSGGGEYDFDAFRRAADWIAKAIAIAPDLANAYVLQGYVFTHLQRNAEAQKAFDRAAELGADSPWLDVNRAELLARTGQRQQAETEYLFASNAAGKPANVRISALEHLADAYLEDRKYESAKRTFQRVLGLEPNDGYAMCNLAGLLRYGLLELDESEKWARQAMRHGGGCENLALTLYLKWAEAANGKDDAKAQRYFDEASELGVDASQILHEVGLYPRPHPIVEALRAKGYSLDNIAGHQGGDTPLIGAVAAHNAAVVRQLVAAGANVDHGGYQNYTPLMIAARRNDLEMVKLLLSLGANPSTLAVENDDAEQMATSRGYTQVAATIAKAKTHVSKTAVAKRDPFVPFRAGYLYRVKKAIRSQGWGVDFESGEEIIFAMPGNMTDPTIASFLFYPVKDASHFRDWGVAKADIGSWQEYFEELGPWQASLK